MRKFFAFLIFFALVFASCDQPTVEFFYDPPPAVNEPTADEPAEEEPVVDDSWQDDPRLTAVDAAATKWLRKPGGMAASSRGIADADPIAAYCTEPGWAYIFYDDFAVIGYEPFSDAVSVMHNAVAITVESHNMEFPDKAWDYINVAPPAPPPPDVSSDPVLDVWQYALCIYDGTIVDGPYTAEYDFNWSAFKSGGAALQLELYNRDHDPDAHIVWGPDA